MGKEVVIETDEHQYMLANRIMDNIINRKTIENVEVIDQITVNFALKDLEEKFIKVPVTCAQNITWYNFDTEQMTQIKTIARKRNEGKHNSNEESHKIGVLGEYATRIVLDIPCLDVTFSASGDGGIDGVLPDGRRVQIKTVSKEDGDCIMSSRGLNTLHDNDIIILCHAKGDKKAGIRGWMTKKAFVMQMKDCGIVGSKAVAYQKFLDIKLLKEDIRKSML